MPLITIYDNEVYPAYFYTALYTREDIEDAKTYGSKIIEVNEATIRSWNDTPVPILERLAKSVNYLTSER